MAISSIVNSTNFVLAYKVGTSEDGKDILKSTSWKCNSSASNDAIFRLGISMSTLFPYGVFDILKVVTSSLIEE